MDGWRDAKPEALCACSRTGLMRRRTRGAFWTTGRTCSVEGRRAQATVEAVVNHDVTAFPRPDVRRPLVPRPCQGISSACLPSPPPASSASCAGPLLPFPGVLRPYTRFLSLWELSTDHLEHMPKCPPLSTAKPRHASASAPSPVSTPRRMLVLGNMRVLITSAHRPPRVGYIAGTAMGKVGG